MNSIRKIQNYLAHQEASFDLLIKTKKMISETLRFYNSTGKSYQRYAALVIYKFYDCKIYKNEIAEFTYIVC
jgi:hypothetical protein